MPPKRSTVEVDWKFLGGLDFEDARQIRRVMAMILHRTGRKINIKQRDSWKRLSREKREIVNRMLQETRGNYLLYDMLYWFAGNLNRTHKDVYDAMATLQKRVTNYVRRRKDYYVEWKKAKKEWKEFREAAWRAAQDQDEDTEDEEMGSTSADDPRPRKTLEQRQRRVATYEVEYVKPEAFLNEDDYPTEDDEGPDDDKMMVDSSSSEEEVEEIEETPKRDYFAVNTEIGGRTRSGQIRKFGEWEQFPGQEDDSPRQKKAKNKSTPKIVNGKRQFAGPQNDGPSQKKAKTRPSTQAANGNKNAAFAPPLGVGKKDEEITIPKLVPERVSKGGNEQDLEVGFPNFAPKSSKPSPKNGKKQDLNVLFPNLASEPSNPSPKSGKKQDFEVLFPNLASELSKLSLKGVKKQDKAVTVPKVFASPGQIGSKVADFSVKHGHGPIGKPETYVGKPQRSSKSATKTPSFKPKPNDAPDEETIVVEHTIESKPTTPNSKNMTPRKFASKKEQLSYKMVAMGIKHTPPRKQLAGKKKKSYSDDEWKM